MEFLVLGALVALGFLALGILWAVVAFAWWLLTLPFRIIGWIFGAIGFLLLLPLLLLVAVGVGVLFVAPLAPLALLGLLVWGLVKWFGRPSAAVGR